jgi:hypothetical protein
MRGASRRVHHGSTNVNTGRFTRPPRAPAKRSPCRDFSIGVAVRREHDHLARRLVADGLVEQVGEVLALGIERIRAAREKHEMVTAEPKRTRPRRRSDEIEDVTAVAMQPPHRLD